MFRITRTPMLLAAAAITATAAQAYNKLPEEPSTPRPAVTSASPVLNLSAQAKKEVPADEMLVTLRTHYEGPDLGIVNQKVLQELNAALSDAKTYAGVDAKVGSFSSQQLFKDNGQPRGWRVSGQLMLESKNLRTLGELAGNLSKKLELGYMGFRLSDEKRKSLEADLLKEAAGAFDSKAQIAAKALGYQSYKLKEVHVSQPFDGGAPVYARVQSYAMSKSMDTEQARSVPTDGGDVTVTVNFSGSITLEQ